jgi:hypothetical protein
MKYTRGAFSSWDAAAQPHRLPEYPSLDEDAHPQDQDFVDYVREMSEAWEASAADSAQA